MVLPAVIYCVKVAAWVWALYFIKLSNRKSEELTRDHIIASSIGSPHLLMVYRLAMLGWALFIGIRQLIDKGKRVFTFYTVWNWWLLTAFFALGSIASLAARWQQRRGRRRRKAQQGLCWLGNATLATFCVVTPMALVVDALTWLVLEPMLKSEAGDSQQAAMWHAAHHNFESYNMSLAVDSLTWLVLVPMLMKKPDSQRYWHERMYSFESYNQHGFNAVMILGELLLNRIPVDFYSSGYLALWSSLFGVWSAIFYIHTGRFIYPFLDAHKPYAWAAYLGLFAVHLVAYLTVMGLARAKQRLLMGQGKKAAVPASSSSSSLPQRYNLRSRVAGAKPVAS